jgi:hypothetical protein
LTTAIVCNGNKFKLTQQSQSIRTLLRSSLHYIHGSIALKNPFPENAERDVMIKRLMRAAAKDLITDLGGEFYDILNRLQEDATYVTVLATSVFARLCT